LEFTSQPGTLKGDNFLGDLGSVLVKAKLFKKDPKVDENGQNFEEKSYHWMVKLLKPDPKEGIPNISRMLGAFDREMRVYRDILPELNEVRYIQLYCIKTHRENLCNPTEQCLTKTPWAPYLDFQLVQLSKNYLILLD
jgi:hypothetical protein